jgi:antiphage defense system Thoeris ThsB-like protein
MLTKGSGGLAPLFSPVKPKVFVSYHHGGDQISYDAFSRTFHDTYDVIYDNSVERSIDSDDPVYVMRRIRENFITGSSCTVVLVGRNTYGRKYVDWEIDATLERRHGLIGICLPSAVRELNGAVIVSNRLYDNIASGFALWLSWEQVVASPSQFPQQVALANSRSATLIANTRTRLLRNLPLR